MPHDGRRQLRGEDGRDPGTVTLAEAAVVFGGDLSVDLRTHRHRHRPSQRAPPGHVPRGGPGPGLRPGRPVRDPTRRGRPAGSPGQDALHGHVPPARDEEADRGSGDRPPGRAKRPVGRQLPRVGVRVRHREAAIPRGGRDGPGERDGLPRGRAGRVDQRPRGEAASRSLSLPSRCGSARPAPAPSPCSCPSSTTAARAATTPPPGAACSRPTGARSPGTELSTTGQGYHTVPPPSEGQGRGIVPVGGARRRARPRGRRDRRAPLVPRASTSAARRATARTC